MDTYTFPSPIELRTIDALALPELTLDDPIFDIFPMEESPYHDLVWEQRDNYIGLQQIRGINSPPPTVAMPGSTQYQMRPGVYGEHIPLDEMQILRTRQLGTLNGSVDLTELVRERQDYLMMRQNTRVKQICWDLLIQGFYQVLDAKGTIVQRESFAQRMYTPSVLWSTESSSTPILDLRNLQLLARGYSMTLGPLARAYMNQQTFNYLVMNLNANDLHGMRTQFGATLNNIGDINAILAGNGLPQVIVHDDWYYDDANALKLLLPDGYVVVVGQRKNGAKLGGFRFVANAENQGNAPGPYVKVIDSMESRVPRTVEVHRGMNAGPVLYYPSAIVIMKVA